MAPTRVDDFPNFLPGTGGRKVIVSWRVIGLDFAVQLEINGIGNRRWNRSLARGTTTKKNHVDDFFCDFVDLFPVHFPVYLRIYFIWTVWTVQKLGPNFRHKKREQNQLPHKRSNKALLSLPHFKKMFSFCCSTNMCSMFIFFVYFKPNFQRSVVDTKWKHFRY